MSEASAAELRGLLDGVVGPTPWYWSTFPAPVAGSGQKFVWTHHGENGPLAYLVSLGLAQEPYKPRLALNSYCRPFVVLPSNLGIWSPEGKNIRFTCFNPDELQTFDFGEIVGWFKQSAERIYGTTAPIADFELPLALSPGMHKIDVPQAFNGLDELIVPSSYPAKSADEPAFALYVFYLQAGLVEVLPQKWFTASQYDVGRQWITRAVRDPQSHRIVGECFGAGGFLLEEDGCRLARWLGKGA